MRLFILIRDEDVTGISGVGIVAEGVEFSDETVVLRWLPAATTRPQQVRPTTVLHDNIDSVIGLHGHDGRTRVVWEEQFREVPAVYDSSQGPHPRPGP
jgi:hypothetical protein